MLIEYEKLLDDEVASGLSIEEIARKFAITPQEFKDIDAACLAEKFGLINQAGIFNLSLDEVSYPIVLDDSKIILIENKLITPGRVPIFEDVIDEVKLECNKILIDEKLKTKLQYIYQNANADNFKYLAKQENLELREKVIISKELSKNFLPKMFLDVIFQTPKAGITPYHIDDMMGYIALIENISVNSSLKKTLNDKYIESKIIKGYLQEFLSYLYKINNVLINYNDPVFKLDE